ncbi:DUF3592 domain-containing protein [bacterium]|nr:DUF3592 domain-containing protein [bacterium]
MLDEILNDTSKLIFLSLVFVIFWDVAISLFFYRKAKQFLETAQRTNATITRLEPDREGMMKHHLIFKDSLGKEIQTASTMRTSPGKYQEGQQIQIIYNPDKPHQVKLENFVQLWMLPVALAYGSVTMAMVLALLVWQGIATWPF